MNHSLKITIILVAMFIMANLIGLYVANFYLNNDSGIKIPYGFDQKPTAEQEQSGVYQQFFVSLIFSFILAILLIIILMKLNSVWFIRGWFFVVVALTLGITINVATNQFPLFFAGDIALVLGIFLAYIKIFKRSIIIHNATELLIYPGISAVFISILNLPFTILLLFIISAYDIWAVWHSGIMQKMAKYQIESIGVFSGFFIPYASKKIKDKIKLLKLKYKEKRIPEKVIKKNNIKVNLAILGGGDITFSTIAAGVAMKTFSSWQAGLIIVAFSTLALIYLFTVAKKKKAYPAMPYLTTGILLGMLTAWLLI
jgi:presenilin-like A22 family membrane protease